MQQKLNTEEVEALVAMAGSDPLAVAVHGINLTLAHHAAWTGEEFEKVNERFDAVERKEAAMGRRFDALDRRFDTVDVALAKVDAHREEMARTLRFIELGQTNQGNRLDDIDRVQMKVLKRLDDLESWQGRLEIGHSKLEDQVRAGFAEEASRHDRQDAGLSDIRLAVRELQDGQDRLETGQTMLESKMETGFAELKAGQGAIVGEMQKLAAQVTKVLNFAIKDELQADEIRE